MSDDTPPSDRDSPDEEPDDTDEPLFPVDESGDSPSGEGPPEGRPEKGRVLSPNDLDITDDEAVEEIDDGRFVVSAGGGPPNVPDDPPDPTTGADRGNDGSNSGSGPAGAGNERGGVGTPGMGVGGPASPEAARNLLGEELGRTRARYGIDVVGRFDGESARHRTVSNDVVATFENLVLWYARHVSDETPAEEVIEILLREASVVPDPGTPNLKELLDKHDLTPHDSIAELVAAITAESGD
ncbi:DUF7500 family protein [Haloglomus halophilum]|uniref:DUF7500 family protein n=1 Tax=Haloglomus halophilum TaxID=2962672 RepID=UPI0020C9ED44|nr:hypothetical protein [Haloglomus halophilum]